MSEINENQDLNEEVSYQIEDADVIPMPIDPTLTHPGEAADAKATGDAIRGMGANININGVRADLTGTFHVYPANIPMSGDQGAQTVEQVLNDIGGRTGEDIVVDSESTTTIADALGSIAETLADKIGSEDVDASLEQVGKVAEAHATGEAIQSLSASIREDLSELDEKAVKSVNDIFPDETGNVPLRVASLAENLLTSKTHESVGEFIIRTADVDASIEDGAAYVQSIKGNSIHTGEVQEVLEMTVTPIEREEPITATLNETTFKNYVQESSVITLYYTSEWSADPELYGIDVTGTPVAGDQININYVKGDRGLISCATPTMLAGTGWNLYDSTKGYARVVKYSDTYGFYIGGAYESLSFAETLNGARSTVVVSDRKFNVPADGYVFVQGGDITSTYIINTWADWVNGGPDDYEPYMEYTVDISSVMAQNFPNGLMRVESVRDEIDFVTQKAISRIERMAYTAENLETVIASGRPYDADESYIYVVRSAPVYTSVTLDSAYTANDHGNELFAGTTVPVYAEILYGVNLKNKLERDTVTYSAQSETATRQARARSNIGAASQSDVNTLNDILSVKTIGTTSVADFSTKIDAILATMTDGEVRNVQYAPSGRYSPFQAYNYTGYVYRVNASNAWADLRRNGDIISGWKAAGVWDWSSLTEWKLITGLVTFAESISATNTRIYANANTVHVQYQGESKTHVITPPDNLIFTLPEGYRPHGLLYAPFTKDAVAYGLLSINTTGEVRVSNITSTTATGRIYSVFSFPINGWVVNP